MSAGFHLKNKQQNKQTNKISGRCDISTAIITIPVGPTSRKQFQGGLIIWQRAMNACCRNITCKCIFEMFGFSDETRPTHINVTVLNQTKKAYIHLTKWKPADRSVFRYGWEYYLIWKWPSALVIKMITSGVLPTRAHCWIFVWINFPCISENGPIC